MPAERQNRDAELRISRQLNLITLFGVIGGFISLIILGVSLWQSRTTLRIDERAWISAHGVTPHTPYIASRLAITINYLNTGKTPGYIDRTVTHIGTSTFPYERIDWFDSSTSGPEVIAPNNRTPITVVEGRPFSDEDFRRLQTGKLRLDFDVSVYYHDAFGKQHITENCVSVTGSIEDLKAGQILPECGPTKMT